MQTFLDRIKNLPVSLEFKNSLLRDIFVVLVNQVGELAPDNFSSEDKTALKEMAEKNDFKKIFEELREHFSEEEWEGKVTEKIQHIINSYEEEVLSVIA